MISADLGHQLEGFVSTLVASGRYNSKSEVLREGVRLVQEREARLAALDLSIARGLADADQGRTRPAAALRWLGARSGGRNSTPLRKIERRCTSMSMSAKVASEPSSNRR